MAVAITSGRSLGSFSPTALTTFETCPAKYAYRYFDKLPTDGPASAPRVLGEACHKALAFLYRLPPADRSVALVHGALRHFWALEPRDGAFTTREDEAAWGQRGLDALDWYCDSYDLAARPLLLEEWVRATLPNQRVIAGRVDRVDEAPDGESVEIVDYKAGACRIRPGALGEDMAAQVYALAAARMLRRPVSLVRFVYVTEQVERTWEPTGAAMAVVEERLVELTDQIACADSFEPQPGPHCRVCDFRAACPASSPAVEDLDTTNVVF